MTPQITEKPNVIDKITIVPRAFYVRAEIPSYHPSGLIKMYRCTRNPPKHPESEFAFHAVRIKNPEELAKLRPVLDYLSGKLGWEELPPILEELEKKIQKGETIDPELIKLASQHPRTALSLLKAIDEVIQGDLELEEFDILSEYMKTALQSLLGKQVMMVNLLTDIINKLGKEKTPEGMQKLLKLLEQHTLPEITTVASIITTRLQKLRIFEAAISNDNAYEIKGLNSIHNQIANSMWIIDDSYWLLHSNEPLTRFLKKEYSKGTKEEKKRPDFVCVSNSHSVVLIEIKRPRKDIVDDDVTQIQHYLATILEHRPEYVDLKGYLIGKNISPHLQNIVDNISNIKFIPYTKLVNDCKRRYQQYLEALEKSKE